MRPVKYLVGPNGEENSEGELAAVYYEMTYYNSTRKYK